MCIGDSTLAEGLDFILITRCLKSCANLDFICPSGTVGSGYCP
jgi:hypothetical protein